MTLLISSGDPTQVREATPARWPSVDAVPALSLAVIRVVIGATAALSAARLLAYGWVDSLVAGPAHRLTYPGLWWVPRPGHAAAIALVIVLGAAGVAVAAGWRTRPSLVVMLVAFCWIEAADATTYLNHYWFLTLVGVLLLVAPSGAALSLDARRRGPMAIDRRWVLLFRAQVACVYVFAAVAKLHADWVVHGLPLRLWLPARSDVPVVGPLLADPVTAHALSLAGLAFDAAIVPLLCWRRTRVGAWLVLVAFHVTTWLLFPIGVFPWVMIGASTIFFAPDWPRRVGVPPVPAGAPVAGPRLRSRWAVALVGAWCLVQVLLPLRHWLIEGDPRWTGEGYRLAWNVLAVESSGELTFRVTDPSDGRTEIVDPRSLLTPNQLRVAATEPELVRQVAHIVADERGGDVEVRADAWVSFNGRAPARLVDPDVDLAAEPASWGHRDWILPAPTSTPP